MSYLIKSSFYSHLKTLIPMKKLGAEMKLSRDDNSLDPIAEKTKLSKIYIIKMESGDRYSELLLNYYKENFNPQLKLPNVTNEDILDYEYDLAKDKYCKWISFVVEDGFYSKTILPFLNNSFALKNEEFKYNFIVSLFLHYFMNKTFFKCHNDVLPKEEYEKLKNDILCFTNNILEKFNSSIENLHMSERYFYNYDRNIIYKKINKSDITSKICLKLPNKGQLIDNVIKNNPKYLVENDTGLDKIAFVFKNHLELFLNLKPSNIAEKTGISASFLNSVLRGEYPINNKTIDMINEYKYIIDDDLRSYLTKTEPQILLNDLNSKISSFLNNQINHFNVFLDIPVGYEHLDYDLYHKTSNNEIDVHNFILFVSFFINDLKIEENKIYINENKINIKLQEILQEIYTGANQIYKNNMQIIKSISKNYFEVEYDEEKIEISPLTAKIKKLYKKLGLKL